MRIARATLMSALAALETHNESLKATADSGDSGNWTAEDQPEYINAATAIAELRLALGLSAS